MTGSAILDLMIALAMFYAALSLVCSALNDLISYQLAWRANNLTAVVRSLLLNSRLPDGAELADELFAHPLVQTLHRQDRLISAPSRWRVVRGLGWVARTFLRNPLRALVLKPPVAAGEGESAPNTRIDTLPTPTFVEAFCDLIRPGDWPTGVQPTLGDFSRWIDALPASAGPLRQTLRALADTSAGDITRFRQKLADWYESAAAQAVGWYRQRMRTTSVIVGLGLCLFFNIDSIEIGNRFYRDANLRTAIVARPPAGSQPPAGADVNQAVANLEDAFRLQLGWGGGIHEAETWRAVRAKAAQNGLLGIVITALAISMGAPFWYDVVNSIRNRALPAKPSPAAEPVPQRV